MLARIRIRTTDLRIRLRILIFSSVAEKMKIKIIFLVILFKSTFASVFIEKKWRDPDPHKIIKDPGDPKTWIHNTECRHRVRRQISIGLSLIKKASNRVRREKSIVRRSEERKLGAWIRKRKRERR